MNTASAVANRLLELCQEKNITVNYLSTLSAVRQSTVNDIVSGKTQNAGVITIKKLCDGLEITLGEFFSTKEFDELEQEIK